MKLLYKTFGNLGILKPCPFCRAEHVAIQIVDYYEENHVIGGPDESVYAVECPRCGTEGPRRVCVRHRSDKENRLKHQDKVSLELSWNRRGYIGKI